MRTVQLAAVVVCCAAFARQVPAQRGGAVEEARAMLSAFADAGERGDWDALARFYDDAPGFLWVERGGVTARSRGDIAAYLARVPAGTRLRTAFDSLEISALSPDIVTATTRTRTTLLTGTPPTVAGSFETRLSLVLVRRPDGWKFRQGHAAEVGGR